MSKMESAEVHPNLDVFSVTCIKLHSLLVNGNVDAFRNQFVLDDVDDAILHLADLDHLRKLRGVLNAEPV